jgi:hypothetical protein
VTTLLYQQANVEIHWDDRGWLYVDWIDLQSGANVCVACEQVLRLLQVKSANSVLNDNTRLKGVWTGAAEWAGSEWLPTMIGAGLKRFAWVEPPSRVIQVSMEQALKFAPPGLVHIFSSRDEAEAWLLWEAEMALKRKSGRIRLLP